MKTFKIITCSEAITEYTITAKNENEAKNKFFEGEYETEEITDFENEIIEKIEELE